ncbi:hypothetical protein PENTCL1PPCAC_22388, partial [Pristionchus entomophagus]
LDCPPPPQSGHSYSPALPATHPVSPICTVPPSLPLSSPQSTLTPSIHSLLEMPAHSTQGSLAIDEQAFHAIQSVGGIQSKAATQIAIIGTAGSSSDDESSRLSSQFSSDSLSRHDDPMNYSREQRSRQLREIRAVRLKARATDEVVQLDCSLDDLPSCLRSEFDQLLRREKAHSVIVYNIVINSLKKYFKKEEGRGSIESRISDFLLSRFIISSVKTRNILEDEMKGMEEAMMEVTSMILLQLYCVLHTAEKERVDKTELVKKLRYIYIHNCSSALKGVLDEEITDVFGSSLPLFISDLFMEVGVDDHIPVDLEDAVEAERRNASLSVSSTVSPATNSPPRYVIHGLTSLQIASSKEEVEKTSPSGGLRPSLSSRLEAMLDEFLEEEEPMSEGGRSTQSQSSQSQGVKRKAPPATPNREDRPARCRRVFVPETPDEKNGEEREGRKTRSQMKDDIKEVVKMTPMEKVMRAKRSTRGELKLAEIVKTSCDSPSLTGVASALRSRGIREEADTRSSRRNGNVLFPSETLLSRAEFLSANRDKGEKKSRVRLNLTTKLGTTIRGEEKDERRIRKKRKTDGNIGALVLDSDATSKYRKRMKETLAEGNKDDDTEVFYGRMSNRVGLFDDRHEREEAKVVYNRAGRVVYSPSCVFVAHTLLNVHNKTPLLPSKPSISSAEFKMNRLVRPASKGNRLKLKKLKERLSLASPKKEIKKELGV